MFFFCKSTAEIPVKPESYDQIMEDFEKKVMPGILHWTHPNFYAYFSSGNAYPSILGDMLSAGIGSIGFSWVCWSKVKWNKE